MKCKRCQKNRRSSSFRAHSNHSSGLAAVCKICDRELRNRDREKISARMKRYVVNNPHRTWANGTYQQHKRKGFRLELSIMFLTSIALHATHCVICGGALRWKRAGKMFPDSPTLDRVDNEKTLNRNNVQIVCASCNTTKGSRTMRQFMDFCAQVVARFPK